VTVAPGKAAPSADFTPPVRVPVWVPWAAATPVKTKARTRASPGTALRDRRILLASKRILFSSEIEVAAT